MFYPIQVPYVLNMEFSKHIRYVEELAKDCRGFAICYWEMQPLSSRKLSVQNIIVADACIDIVVNYDEKSIGFVGMRKTEFNFQHKLPNYSFGIRMLPGAFHQLTGLSATMAIDTFLSFKKVFIDFDSSSFFSLSFEQAKMELKK